MITFLCVAVIILSVLQKKATNASYDLQSKVPTQSPSMNISGPTDVRVISSTMRGLDKMLPAHIHVPMTSRLHNNLYEDYVAAQKMPSTKESDIEMSLQDGMDECRADIPTPYIDEDQL